MLTATLKADAPRSYLRQAFLVQYNVILLGGAALFSLAAASSLPLALGLTLEAVWLAVGPRLEVFQRWADAQEERDSEGEEEPARSQREPAPRGRPVAFERMLMEIRTLGPTDSELEPALSRLEPVGPGFVRLCGMEERLSLFLANVQETALEAEVLDLKRTFAEETDLGARVTVRQAITLTERRLEQRKRLDGLRRTVTVKLNLVEKSVAHVRSLRVALRPVREIASEIDSIVLHLAAVDALEHEIGET